MLLSAIGGSKALGGVDCGSCRNERDNLRLCNVMLIDHRQASCPMHLRYHVKLYRGNSFLRE